MRIKSVADAASPSYPQGRRPVFSSCFPFRRGAFTLVELLVAMAVSLLLIFVLLRVFATATTSWQRGEAQADAYREARGALQFMARDLSTTIQPVTTALNATTSYASPLLPTLVLNHYPATLNPTPPHTADEDLINDEVYCLTNVVNSSTPAPASSSPSPGPASVPSLPSEICSVGYFCQWMPAIATEAAQSRAPHAFALMRQFLNSDGVFKRMLANSRGTIPLDFGTLYTRDSLLPGTAPAQDPPASSSTQLAAYIWDLKFRIDTNLVGATDGTATAPYDHSNPPRVYNGVAPPYPGVVPPYVEIRFKALSTGAGRRLEGNTVVEPKDWKDSTSTVYKQFILPSARQFVLRVPLINSNPLPNP